MSKAPAIELEPPPHPVCFAAGLCNTTICRTSGKGFFGEENLSLRTQLDITQFDKIYLPIQTKPLSHPYSDATVCTASIRCQKLEEILASKLTTLLHRCKPVDLFDLLYSVVFRNEYGVVQREVITTFLRKSIFEATPGDAREQLLAVPLDSFKEQWRLITAPIASLFSFDFVVGNFAALINSFFSLLAPPPAGAGAGSVARIPPRIVRPGGGMSRPVPFGRNYFPADARQTIMAAGRTQTMVELLYGGYSRLVEPYKLEYYVRKYDGRGLEYFWGYDTSGGKSRKVGIKQFICDKIQSVNPTQTGFAPRFEVDL